MARRMRAAPGHQAAPRDYPRINFRVDEELRARIDRDAAAHGLKVGSYMRMLAGGSERTRAVRNPLPDERLLLQLKGQVGRIGGNLHQLLRLANRGEIPPVEELEEAVQATREFLAYALELLQRGE